MSLWQFAAAVGGWAKANGGGGGDDLNREEIAAASSAFKRLRPDLH